MITEAKMNRRGFLQAIGIGFAGTLTSASGFQIWAEPAYVDAELSFSAIMASTIQKHLPEIIKNIETNNALLRRLGTKPFTGGITIP